MSPFPRQTYLFDLSKQVGVHAVALLGAHGAKVVLHADLGHQLIQSALEQTTPKPEMNTLTEWQSYC